MKPQRSAPVALSNAAAAQAGEELELAAVNDAQGVKLMGDSCLYTKNRVLLLGPAVPLAKAAAEASDHVGSDDTLLGSMTSCGGDATAVKWAAPGRLATDARVSQSTALQLESQRNSPLAHGEMTEMTRCTVAYCPAELYTTKESVKTAPTSAFAVSTPHAMGCLSVIRLPTHPVDIQPSGGHMSTWKNIGRLKNWDIIKI